MFVAQHVPRRRRRSLPAWRVRRIVVIAAALALLPGLISYLSMLTQRSDSALGVRTVEWLRDNGARGIVNQVENWYYSLNAPAKGGPALKALPTLPGAEAGVVAPLAKRLRRLAAPPYLPKPIPPAITPALPGEGIWRATFAGGSPAPPVLITSFRPNRSYPRIVVGVAWINHLRTSAFLYPGIQEPAVTLADRGPEEVPTALRSRLVATFNSGFKLADSGGGFAIGGRTYAPMKRGQATILRYRSGALDVRAWSAGPEVPSNVLYAQQNLPLIVDGGKANPNLSDGPEWGATLGNAIQVWRSAVGIDAHGNLLYAAGNDQTVGSLAAVMIRAGAVRAMEMDINSYWPSFITYRRAGAVDPANLLPGMTRSPYRYLTPDDRDFFAVYLR